MFNQVQQIVEGGPDAGRDLPHPQTGEAIGIENSPALIEEIVPLAQGNSLDTIHTRRFGASEDAGFLIERVQQHGGEAAYLILGANLAAPTIIRSSTSTKPCWPQEWPCWRPGCSPASAASRRRMQTKAAHGLPCFYILAGIGDLLSQHDRAEMGEVVDLVGRLARACLPSRVVPAGGKPWAAAPAMSVLGLSPPSTPAPGSADPSAPRHAGRWPPPAWSPAPRQR